MKQCLFDWKNFYNFRGAHKYFPASLCFPQYFLMCIISMPSKIPIMPKFFKINYEDLCQLYVDILPIILKILYPEYNIKCNSEKLRTWLRNWGNIVINYTNNNEKDKDDNNKDIDNNRDNNKDRDNDNNDTDNKNDDDDDDDDDDIKLVKELCLENFLMDKASIQNYRSALLRNTFAYFNCNDLNKVTEILYDNKCCSNKLPIMSTPPPPSYHYLLDRTKITNCRDIPRMGPVYWGPFYWNILHYIGENYYKNYNEVKFLRLYTCLLPFIIPCNNCSINYTKHDEKIKTILNNYGNDIEKLYSNIHNVVNDDLLWRNQQIKVIRT